MCGSSGKSIAKPEGRNKDKIDFGAERLPHAISYLTGGAVRGILPTHTYARSLKKIRIGPIRPICPFGPSEKIKALIMQCRVPVFCFWDRWDGSDRSPVIGPIGLMGLILIMDQKAVGTASFESDPATPSDSIHASSRQPARGIAAEQVTPAHANANSTAAKTTRRLLILIIPRPKRLA